MPKGIIDDEFFHPWDLATLRKLSKIELRIDHENLNRDIWFPPLNRRIHRLRSICKSIGNGNKLPFPKIWSYLSWTVDNALSTDPSMSSVEYQEECKVQDKLDSRLAPRESLRHSVIYESHGVSWDELEPPNPSIQMVTVNQQDIKKMLDRLGPLEPGRNLEEIDHVGGGNKEVEDKLQVAIRIVDRQWRSEIPEFRINIQVEGINHTRLQRQALWDDNADMELFGNAV